MGRCVALRVVLRVDLRVVLRVLLRVGRRVVLRVGRRVDRRVVRRVDLRVVRLGLCCAALRGPRPVRGTGMFNSLAIVAQLIFVPGSKESRRLRGLKIFVISYTHFGSKEAEAGMH